MKRSNDLSSKVLLLKIHDNTLIKISVMYHKYREGMVKLCSVLRKDKISPHELGLILEKQANLARELRDHANDLNNLCIKFNSDIESEIQEGKC